MAGEGSQSDFWDALEEAEMTVERWPPWQQQYDPDIFYEDDAPEQLARGGSGTASSQRPVLQSAVRCPSST
jgi:hypothetical protein